MGEFDRQHRTKIAVDEWGSWHRPGTELKPTHLLGQQNTMRDALVASLSLDAFNRNSDKVVMANVAQLVNCLHSLFLADGDRFLLTPTYHIFDMFTPHMGARAVRTVFSSPPSNYQRNGKPADLWGLNGSASINGKQLTLTVTNSHMSEPREAEIAIRGAAVSSARARVLSHKDVHAHNTFEDPRVVTPRDETPRTGQPTIFTFPPASATRLTFDLQ
jgi:alpha-N-arabinofuranosidase